MLKFLQVLLQSNLNYMIVDIALYEKNKPIVIDWFKKSGDVNRTIGMMASITFVPCIVIAYWLGEYTNWHPDTVAAVKRLQEFYDYSSILNKPEGSPL